MKTEFKLSFETTNSDFDAEDRGAYAVQRLLKDIAKDIMDGYVSGPIRDINGNTIGQWEWK